MRVLCATPSAPHSDGVGASRIWHRNLLEGLAALGHELVVFEPSEPIGSGSLDLRDPRHAAAIRRRRARRGEELLRQAAAAGPIDLFFSYFYSADVEPDAVRELGARVPTVNWFCNASYQFDLIEELAPAYDVCLVPERFRLDDYRRVGANPLYCQEAASPTFYRPLDVPRRYDAAFVGQRYGHRPFALRRLIDEGIDAHAFGPRWDEAPPQEPRGRVLARRLRNRLLRREGGYVSLPADAVGGPLDDDEYVAMFSRSRITLGFTSVAKELPDGTLVKQVRLRDFEAPMSGAFYLVEDCDELHDFFEPAREIETFADDDELVDKARWYLHHPDERERIGRAGLARARAEHTWAKRFQAVFAEMGL